MIHVAGLTKHYGPIAAIADVSFDVPEGRILGFLGPNGAGKTTTMRILTGYMPATSGAASVAGYDVFTQSLDVRKRIGYLPERVPLYREMRVRDYLAFVAAVKGLPRASRAAQIDEAMRSTAIEDVQGRIVGNLSRGYQQRVGLAQALIGDPPILILDEPTVGLDPKQIVEIRQLISSFKGRRTIILSTHILPEVQAVCDDVAIINEGRIVVRDSLEGLTATDRAVDRLQLRVAGPAADIESAVRSVAGVVSVERAALADGSAPVWEIRLDPMVDPRAAIARTVVNGGWDLLELQVVRATLEDIFLQTLSQQPAREPAAAPAAAEAEDTA